MAGPRSAYEKEFRAWVNPARAKLDAVDAHLTLLYEIRDRLGVVDDLDLWEAIREDYFRAAARAIVEYFSIPEPNSGCWIWLGFVQHGYGIAGLQGTNYRAPRLSMIGYKGRIGRLFACHKCDTPLCVNPDHLFAGTHQENMSDMVSKGRHRTHSGDMHWRHARPDLAAKYLPAPPPVRRGEENGQAKLTDDQVARIMAMPGKQSEIAAMFGVTQGHVSRIKRGVARADYRSLADADDRAGRLF